MNGKTSRACLQSPWRHRRINWRIRCLLKRRWVIDLIKQLSASFVKVSFEAVTKLRGKIESPLPRWAVNDSKLLSSHGLFGNWYWRKPGNVNILHRYSANPMQWVTYFVTADFWTADRTWISFQRKRSEAYSILVSLSQIGLKFQSRPEVSVELKGKANQHENIMWQPSVDEANERLGR